MIGSRVGTYNQGGVVPFAFGNALLFDGANDYVSLANRVNLTGQFTAVIWVKPDVVDATLRVVIGKNTATTRCNVLYRSSDVIVAAQGINAIVSTGFTVTQGVWNQIAITKDATNTYRLYINAVLRGTSASGLSSPYEIDYVGRYEANYHDGPLDQFNVWNGYCATLTNIQDLYNSGAGAEPSDIIASPLVDMKFNESGTATTATNSGSGGATYNGTLVNFPASGMWVAH